MNIAVFSGEVPAPTFIENLIETLSEAGHQVYLFGYARSKKKYGRNVSVTLLPASQIGRFLFILKETLVTLAGNPMLCIKVWRMVMNNYRLKDGFWRLAFYLPIFRARLHAFHFQWGNHLALFPELIEQLPCPVFLSLRGAHINYSPLFDTHLAAAYHKLFPLIRGFHGVSNAIGTEAEKYGAPADRIATIYSSVSPEVIGRYKPPGLYEPGELRLISVGRFHWKKGYDYALRAVKMLRDMGLNARYTLVAQGGLPEETRYEIVQLGLEKWVEVIHGLPHPQVIDRIQKSHLLLLPSVEEGVANVVLEAMAVGTLVVSTDCGGMTEVIDDGRSGFIVPVRQPEAMAAAVVKYTKLTQPERAEMAEAARQHILTRHTRQTMLSGFMALYQK